MAYWIWLIGGLVVVIAAAVRWGRSAAIAAWLMGLLSIVGWWIALIARGEDAFWTFMIVVVFGGFVWAVLGGVAAVQALGYRALRRESRRVPTE